LFYCYVRGHYGIELPPTTKVGRRVLIAHQSGIVIHSKADIGDDCLIRQNVTIGARSHKRWWEAPKLGNGVQVGCGAAILGDISVGDGVIIGANAVVMTDVPPGVLVVVQSPRIIVRQSCPDERHSGDLYKGHDCADPAEHIS
jgi:serine O-acetyltransferase